LAESKLRIPSAYKKLIGIFGLLVAICIFTAWQAPDSFLKASNIENTIRWTALFGIISIGVSFVIMTGGIDLSIGSVVGLIGCLLAMSLKATYLPHDLLTVDSVIPDRGEMRVPVSADVYRPDDWLSFLDKKYRVKSVSGQTIAVEPMISTGAAAGKVRRVYPVSDLGEESVDAVGVGSYRMHLRSVTIPGETKPVRAGDQIELLYEIGLDQKLPVHDVEQTEGETVVHFLVRHNQKVNVPQFVAFQSRSQVMSTPIALLLILAFATFLGWVHGMLITKVPLQPFVVTLCGLLFYRGLARYITGDQEQGFGSELPEVKEYAKGGFFRLLTGEEFSFDLPMPFIYMTVLGVIAAIFLNKTIYGRYILALGRNEQAARFSGISTDRMKIVAYMICSFCGGVAGILFSFDLNSIQPSGHGEFYELYAIAAAVLGGCSLRGGEGSILGVVIAAAVMRVLNNAINLVEGIDTTMEFAIIGLVILIGVIADELVRRFAARQRALAKIRDTTEAAS
jgi:ribose transport system permease protein